MHRSRRKRGRDRKHRDHGQGQGRGGAEGGPGPLEDLRALGAALDPPPDPPYEVRVSEVMGRYLVATREVSAGEEIIGELPLVVGPSQNCPPLCLGCYRRLDELCVESYRCERCGWPLCEPACSGLGAELGHSPAECAALAAAAAGDLPRRVGSWPLLSPELRASYHALVPLRCLLLKDSSPERWSRLRTLESHTELRRGLKALWASNQELVVDRIRGEWGMQEYAEEEIHDVCGVLEVNSFEVGEGGCVRALYPAASLLAHDCVPSTGHADAPGSFRLSVWAARRLLPGDSFTLTYAYTLQGTLKRREHLRASKFFDCVCARCADPTELGSFASALRCPGPGCPGPGRVLPARPLDADSEWRCDACAYSLPARSLRKLLDRVSEELEALDANDVPGFEGFLQRYSNVLGPGHYLALSAEHSLALLYGKAPGYQIAELPDRLLRRKRDLCRHLLAAFDVLEPGMSRLRGEFLYELHAPLMVLATRGFESGAQRPGQLAEQLRAVLAALREAAAILELEPAASAEGQLAAAARDALARTRHWEAALAAL